MERQDGEILQNFPIKKKFFKEPTKVESDKRFMQQQKTNKRRKF